MNKRQNRSVLEEIILLIPNLIKLLYGMVKDPRVRLQEKMLLLGTILYVVSPIDLVPDFIPFLGQVDDILLVSLIILRFLEQAGPDLVSRHWQGQRSILEIVRSTLKLSAFFLPRDIYNKIVKNSGYQGDVIDVTFRVHRD